MSESYKITSKGQKAVDILEDVSDKMQSVLDLAKEGTITKQELVKNLGIDKKTATHILELLEEKKFIECID